ncbi:hypothetical protein BDZ97DRAFT_1764583 [Flammula alnicola]|nr:hypothetical protein BDZ97DRAFT_1764583 [Flammula alnicola]
MSAEDISSCVIILAIYYCVSLAVGRSFYYPNCIVKAHSSFQRKNDQTVLEYAALLVRWRRHDGRHAHLPSSSPNGHQEPLRPHILGQPAVGDLKRPFMTPSMFGPAAGPQTDATAEAEAEKRVGDEED